MKRRPAVALTACIVFGGLVFAQKVTYNFDQGADFSKYKTYKWVEIANTKVPDALIDKQIKGAIDSQLALKGLTRVESDEANLLVGYQLGFGTEKQITSYGGYGYGARWGGMSTATTSTVRIGQLVLDMYDPAMKQVVWRGMGVKEVDETAKPDKRTKNLAKGVGKMLKNYPPKKS